jgi:uncharacterized protein (TIGR02679 family)
MSRAPDPTAERPVVTWARTAGAVLVLDEARRRWQAGHRGDRVRLDVALTPDQRRDVGRLLGLDWLASGRALTLGQLRAAVGRAEPGWGVPDLLVATGGELRDLRDEREQLASARAGRRAQLTAALLAAGVPAEAAELAAERRWLGGIDDPETARRSAAVAAVLAVLPSRGPTLLASLASEILGDPHALDRAGPAGRAAARLLAAGQAVAAGEDPRRAADFVATAAGWRETWAAASVACDQVSSTVLVLNLPLPGAGPVAALSRVAAQAGEPLWLTARMLRPGWEPAPGSLSGLVVRVCENPSVVEAAAQAYGAACPPLACTYGRPAGAAWTLLRGVVAAGALIVISGDRDTAGQAITRDLITGLPCAAPWLPGATGLYEEERLPDFLRDLAPPDPAGRADSGPAA